MSENNKTQYSGSTNPRRERNRKRKPQKLTAQDPATMQAKLDQLTSKINSLHRHYKFSGPEEAKETYRNNRTFRGQVNNLMSQNQNNPLFPRYLDHELAEKIINHFVGNDPYLSQHKQELKLAILIDDWPSVLKTAAKYLPMVPEMFNRAKQLKNIWMSKANFGDKVAATFSLPSVASNAQIMPSSDNTSTTTAIVPFGTKTNIFPTQADTHIQAFANQGPERLIVNDKGNMLKFDSVSIQYICAMLCPEKYVGRKPVPYPQETGLVRSKSQLVVTTNSAGNCDVYIFGTKLWSKVSSGTPATDTLTNRYTCFAMNYRADGPTFDIGTGVQPLSSPATYYAGPLASKEVMFERATAFSVTVLPNADLDQSKGIYTMAYSQIPANKSLADISTVNGPATTMDEVLAWNFVKQYPITQSSRMLMLPLEDNLWYNNAQIGDGWQLLHVKVRGATPSTSVMQLDVAYSGEYVPLAPDRPYVIMEYPPVGSATSDFVRNLIQAKPSIQNLTCQQAAELCKKLIDSNSSDYNELMRICCGGVTDMQKAFQESCNLGANADSGIHSFELD